MPAGHLTAMLRIVGFSSRFQSRRYSWNCTCDIRWIGIKRRDISRGGGAAGGATGTPSADVGLLCGTPLQSPE